jgi:hypothetical protein
VYCGAVGHLGPTGDARFSVAIRTAVVDRHTGQASYGSGGGITWCSDPSAEYAELLTKTRILRGCSGSRPESVGDVRVEADHDLAECVPVPDRRASTRTRRLRDHSPRGRRYSPEALLGGLAEQAP